MEPFQNSDQKPQSEMNVSVSPNGSINHDTTQLVHKLKDKMTTNQELICEQSMQLHHKAALAGTYELKEVSGDVLTASTPNTGKLDYTNEAKEGPKDPCYETETFPNLHEKLKSITLSILEKQFYSDQAVVGQEIDRNQKKPSSNHSAANVKTNGKLSPPKSPNTFKLNPGKNSLGKLTNETDKNEQCSSSNPKTLSLFDEVIQHFPVKDQSDQLNGTLLGKRGQNQMIDEANDPLLKKQRLDEHNMQLTNLQSDQITSNDLQNEFSMPDQKGLTENPEVITCMDEQKLDLKSNTNRPKRNAKKLQNQDMVYQLEDMNEEINSPLRKPVVNKNNLKNMRISDNQDPFNIMYKHIMEPILQLDRLEVLRESKIEFDVILYPKDLKNLAKKDEFIKSRVHIDCDTSAGDPLSSFIIEINCDENFERHSKDREMSRSQQKATESNNEDEGDLEEENEDIKDLEGDQEMKDMSKQVEQVKQNKKRRKKGKPLCIINRKAQNNMTKKPYQTYLPQSLSECSWLENTPKNIQILDQKNNQLKIEREIKKEQELQTLQQIDLKIQDNYTKPETSDQLEMMEEPKVTKLEEEEELNEFVVREDLRNLDQIEDRFRHAYYPNLDRLIEDLKYIVLKSMQNRCQNSLAKIYLTNFLLKAVETIKSKKREFINKWITYYKVKLYNNQGTNCIVGGGDETVWYNHFDESTKRAYFEVKDYKIKVPGEEDEHGKMIPLENQSEKQQKEFNRIQEIMKTKKKTQCDGKCCMKTYQDILSSNPKSHLVEQLQNEKCGCAKEKVECGPECGCDPKLCYNRQMSENQSLRFGVDVEEKVSWGMDICTQVNFLTIMPRNVPFKIQSVFVEKKLVYAIQQQGEEGYNVLKALNYIMDADLQDEILKDKYTNQDMEIARILHDAIQNLPQKNIVHFRIHSKGLGIFCRRKAGIQTNSLVIEYFGEIYRPWHWFEKQDVIKQGQHAKKLPNDLPDFYNITFERHLNDPHGYNILTVDPILHGNYSSRLSHSCFPNCQTINKVRNGQYSIGMFTKKDITYGEELCFDYCSFTESEKEFEEAVCLCGTAFCKGKYLNLANDKKNLGVMKNDHTFLDRNYIIFKAITQGQLSGVDNARLKRNGLNESALKEAPEWLMIWASLVCEYLEYEEEKYPEFFKDDYPAGFAAESIKIDSRAQKETQIQNIAITIDKVMHVLDQMETEEPPIISLNYEDRYNRLWTKEGCLKDAVLDVIEKIEKDTWNAQVTQAYKLITETDNRIFIVPDGANAEVEYQKRYHEVRNVLASVSNILRSVNSTKVAIPAFCDILMMYANTEEYFTQSEIYKRCKSDKVNVRRCDVKHGSNAQMDKVSQGQNTYTGQKEYDSQYIWGQLVGWFKQTVNKPNASLSADRRGTLSIPDVQSFIIQPNKLVFEDQHSSKPVVKKKRAKKGLRESEEEIMPINGSRSRPVRANGKGDQSMEDESISQSPQVHEEQSPKSVSDQPNLSVSLHQRKLKIVYPSKRYSERKEFLQNWKENFSKQWDICCEWNFQNKMKMYGSLQFESIIRADRELPQELSQEKQIARYKTYLHNRLNYFDGVVSKLLQYNQ